MMLPIIHRHVPRLNRTTRRAACQNKTYRSLLTVSSENAHKASLAVQKRNGIKSMRRPADDVPGCDVPYCSGLCGSWLSLQRCLQWGPLSGKAENPPYHSGNVESFPTSMPDLRRHIQHPRQSKPPQPPVFSRDCGGLPCSN